MDSITLIAASAFLSGCILVARSTPAISSSSFLHHLQFSHDVTSQMDKAISSFPPFYGRQLQLGKEQNKQQCIHSLTQILQLSDKIRTEDLFRIEKLCDSVQNSRKSDDNPLVIKNILNELFKNNTHPSVSSPDKKILQFSEKLQEPDNLSKSHFIPGISRQRDFSTFVKHRLSSHLKNITNLQETAETSSNTLSSRFRQSQMNLSKNRLDTSYSKRTSISTRSESPLRTAGQSPQRCRHRVETKLVYLPGCVPKSMLTTRCEGSCHSRSVPEWDVESQELRNVEHCTCCAPNSMRVLQVRFRCPGRERGFLIKRVAFPFQCSCRPCAIVGEVESEQPYDYD